MIHLPLFKDTAVWEDAAVLVFNSHAPSNRYSLKKAYPHQRDIPAINMNTHITI